MFLVALVIVLGVGIPVLLIIGVWLGLKVMNRRKADALVQQLRYKQEWKSKPYYELSGNEPSIGELHGEGPPSSPQELES